MNITFITTSFNKIYAPHICFVRHRVFTIEQKIDATEDLDGADPDSIHILVKEDHQYIGTGRMMKDGHIGRLAVLKDFRHQQIGSRIIDLLIAEAKIMKLPHVYLGAQCRAIHFYQKLGFSVYGKEFQEVGISHIMMKKK